MGPEAWKYLVQIMVGIVTASFIWAGNLAWETRAVIYQSYDLLNVLVVRTQERYENEFPIPPHD